MGVQRVPALRGFRDLKKTVLRRNGARVVHRLLLLRNPWVVVGAKWMAPMVCPARV